MSKKTLSDRQKYRSGWWWVPTLYYAEGIPYIIVMMVSVAMYKMLGVSNAKFAFWTSILYLPWSIKPLWSPIVEMLSYKRNWITVTQFLLGALFLGIAFTVQLPWFFPITILIFWFMAFSSATHDIAADGFYMLGLTEKKQAFFVGIRSTFYRFAMMTGQGLLLILVGFIETGTGLPPVEVPVKVIPRTQVESQIDIRDLNLKQREGELHLVCQPDSLQIPIKHIGPAAADSIITWAKNWNIRHEHIQPKTSKKEQQEASLKAPAANGLNWLERFIMTRFGEEIEEKKLAGNLGLIYIRLSRPPQEREGVGVNFGRIEGDKSILLAHGEHFAFNAENWNKPAIAVIQLHPNLEKQTRAIFEARAGNTELAWSMIYLGLGILFIVFAIYHRMILPHPPSDQPKQNKPGKNFLQEFARTFKLFFKKNDIGIYVAFLLLYRFSESQLVKLAQPFMLDAQENGGLALTAGEVGFAYGTIGIIMLIIGGVSGGILASRHGLKKWLFGMALAINLPNAVYIFMAYTQPDNFITIIACVGLEQLGYGFGFTAYMLFMIYVAQGEYKTAHFAITTAFMALGMMIPGMWTGWLQELIGYKHFFIWVLICIIPIFTILPLVYRKVDPTFGIKEQEKSVT